MEGVYNMKNNRQYNRYSIKCSGEMSDECCQDYKFIMNDISAGGMRITTDMEMADESPLTIQLDMSQILPPHTKTLQGTVVHKKEENAVFVYGIQFLGMTNTETEEIDEYLRDRHYSSLVHIVENPA